MTLSRARRGKDMPEETLKEVEQRLRTCIYQRLRTQGAPISHPNSVTDTVFSVLINLYERLLPKLQVGGLSEPQVMWVLAESVFVPTVFAVFVENRSHGLGSEFRGSDCWYVPVKGEAAFQRVLGYWLRAADLHTGYGLSKHLSPAGQPVDQREDRIKDNLKSKFEDWTSGRSVPQSLSEVYEYVDQLAQQVAWLDESDAWKARLRLAFAVDECGLLMEG